MGKRDGYRWKARVATDPPVQVSYRSPRRFGHRFRLKVSRLGLGSNRSRDHFFKVLFHEEPSTKPVASQQHGICCKDSENIGRVRRWAIQLKGGGNFHFPIIPLQLKIERKFKLGESLPYHNE
ncbi:hypothetical protein AVEN_194233-1 [Araneus ventricosus]|uniref:Uncharacterized protein n=1 Tax=Araneus ventricosus TaxID=182803 RepID=A0A4Y2HGI4_ARAVE|nr:hypothetical protein AVEN_194233-1 [Araneus ventricosus]